MSGFVPVPRIPLERAYLCGDCGCVGDRASVCGCGSEHGLAPLAALLDRKPVASAPPRFHLVSRSVGEQKRSL